MKLKLLFFILCVTVFVAQAQVTDFISGLNQPNRLIIDDDIIYVKGVAAPGEIYAIDLNESTPSATVFFNSLPMRDYPIGLGNITKVGPVFYISFVNDNTGESTLASFNENTPTVLNTLATGLGFVNALAFYNGELYFTDEDVNVGGTSLRKIAVDVNGASVNTVLTGLTNPQDMEFNNEMLYIADRDASNIFSVDVSATSPSLTTFIDDVNVLGLYVFNSFLYFSDNGVIRKVPFSDATNVTTEAEDIGSDELLRDVVINDTTLYMVQENAGEIVIKEDATLSINDFNENILNIIVYNDESEISIKGLTEELTKVEIFNLSGKTLLSKEVALNNASLDISFLPKGFYILNIDNKKSVKFVK